MTAFDILPTTKVEDILQLAKKGLSYAAQGITFTSDLHPRDHYGRFAKKDHGLFTLLKDIKGGTYQGVSHSGPAGHTFHPDLPTEVKIGGVIITPPENKGYAYSEHHIDWALHPGEKVYKVHSVPDSTGNLSQNGQTGAIVHHADGSATVLLPTPEGEMPKVGVKHSHFSDLLAQLTKGGYTVDTDHPLDQNLKTEAAKYDQSVADAKKAKEIGAAPESIANPSGSSSSSNIVQKIQDEQGNHLGHVEKTADGKYTSHNANGDKIGNTAKHIHTAIEKVKSGKLTTPSTYEHKKPAKEAAKAAAEPTGKHFSDIHNDAGKHIGHIEKTPEGKYTSHDQNGEKIGKTAKHLDTAIAKVHENHATQQTVNDALGKKTEEPKPSAVDTAKQAAADIAKKQEDANPYGPSIKVGQSADHSYQGTIAPLKGTKEVHAFDANGNHLSTHLEPIDAIQAVKKNFANQTSGKIKNILDDNGNKIGHVEQTPEGKWESWSNDGEKLGYTIGNLQKAIEKVHAANGTNPTPTTEHKPEEKPFLAPKDELMAEWEKELLGVPNANTTWTSPTGFKVELKPGQALYSYPDKAYMASPIFKDGKVENMYLPQGTGKMLSSIDGTVPGHVAAGWEDEFNQGNLVKVAENAVSEKHVTPAVEKAVEEAVKNADEAVQSHVYMFPGTSSNAVTLQPGDQVWGSSDGGGFWVNHADGTHEGYLKDGQLVITNSPITTHSVQDSNIPSGWKKLHEVPLVESAQVTDPNLPVEKYNAPGSDTHLHVFSDGSAKFFSNKAWGGYGPEYVQPKNVVESQAAIENIKKEGWTKEDVGNAVQVPKVAGATPKNPAKKVTKDANLPESFVSKEGHDFKAGFDSSVWHNPDKGLVLVLDSTGTAYLHSENGNPYSSFGGKTTKKHLTELGYEKVAVGKPAPADTEIPKVAPGKEFSTVKDAHEYVYYGEAHENALSYGSEWKKVGAVNPQSPSVGEDLAKHLATLHKIKEDYYDDFSQASKAKLTKVTNNVTTAYKIHALAAKISNPDWKPNEEDSHTFSTLGMAASNEYDLSNGYHALEKMMQDKVFQSSINDIGFDLVSGSHEQFSNYALQHGIKNIGGMDEKTVKDWVLADLKKPGHYFSKEGAEKTAGHVVAKKAVIAHNEQVKAKKEALKPSKEEQLVEKAVAKKASHEYAVANKLNTMYSDSNDATHTMLFDSFDMQFHEMVSGNKTGKSYQPSEVRQMVSGTDSIWNKTPETFPVSDVARMRARKIAFAYGYPHPSAADLSEHSLDIVKTETGNSQYFTKQQADDWLMAHLRGDEVAKFSISASAWFLADDNLKAGASDTFLNNHAGSPLSASGIAARQALSDWLSTQDWFDSSKGKITDVFKASEALGLEQASEAAGVNNAGLSTLAKRWEEQHKALPTPSTNISVDSASINLPDGTKLDVPHGSYVLQNSPGQSDSVLLVIDPSKEAAGNHVSVYFKNGPSSSLGAKGKSAESYLETYVNSGYQNITPKWGSDANGTSEFKGYAEKPTHVQQENWDLVTGSEIPSKELAAFVGKDIMAKSDSEIASMLSLSYSGFNKQQALQIMASHESIKKLAAWASNIQNNGADFEGDSDTSSDIIASLTAKLGTGELISSATTKWDSPEGHSITMPPGADVIDTPNSSYYFLGFGKSSAGFKIMKDTGKVSGSFNANSAGALYSSGKILHSSPQAAVFDKAVLEGQTFSSDAFDTLLAAEKKDTWTNYDHNEVGAAWNFAQSLKSIPGGENYAGLTDKLHNFPVGVKQLAMESAQHGNTDVLDALQWKAAKGSYVKHPKVLKNPIVPEGKSYSEPIAGGQVTQESVYNWPYEAVNDFLTDYPGLKDNDGDLVNTGSGLTYQAQAIAAHLKQLDFEINKPVVEPDPKQDYANLELIKTHKEYGGMHSKSGYADKFGREWMGKFYTHDPNSAYRLDAEHYANVIGKSFGFTNATTFVKDVNGTPTLVQLIAENDGSLKGHGPADLTDAQLKNVASEHVLDWLLSNHDSHEDNLLRAPNQSNIIGIDKGQAFKHLHDDQLGVGYLPPENGASVWYDKIYNGIANKSISEEKANSIALAVLLKAHKVATQKDEIYQNLVTKALAKRDFWPEEYPTREAFIGALMDRKHSLVSDFEKLYKEQFAKAGYDWNINTEDFGKAVGLAITQNSPQFAAALPKAGGLGKSLFFNSPDIEDHHIIMTHMEQKDGKDGLLGSLKVMKEADTQVTHFLHSLINGNLETGASAKVGNADVLPHVDNFHSALVAYIQTVNNHAPNGGKNPDGAYNASSVASALDGVEKANKYLAELDFWEKDHPGELVKKGPDFPFELQTLEQQDALSAALKQQVGYWNTITQAKNQGVKVNSIDPDFPTITPISYTPSKNLTSHDESYVAEKYKLNNGEWAFKTSDGGHYIASSEKGDDKKWISASVYNNEISMEGSTWSPVMAEDAPYWVGEDGKTKYSQLSNGNWLEVSTAHSSTPSNYILSNQELVDYISSQPINAWQFHTSAKEQSSVVQTNTKQFKVTKRTASGHLGSLDPVSGKMIQVLDKAQGSELHPGQEYTIEHDNVKIHYRPWNEPGVARTQQGLMNFEIKNWNGSHEQIANVLDTLETIGINMTPADAQSMELGYYRQMTNIIDDRNTKFDGPSAAILSEVKSALAADPYMSESDQLDLYRKSWAEHYKVNPDTVDWQPHFDHNGKFEEGGGRPHWYRPDVNYREMKAIYDEGTLASHQLRISSTGSGKSEEEEAFDRTYSILASGRLLSTEERLRLLNKVVKGTSSSEDQVFHGSSAYMYTTQNQKITYANDTSVQFLFSPAVSARHTNYSYSYDAWGEVSNRTKNGSQGAPFDADQMYAQRGGEMMVKNEAPVEFAIVGSTSMRDKLIARLRAEGYDTVNGKALEDVIFAQQQWNDEYQARIEKLWEELIAEQEKYLKGE